MSTGTTSRLFLRTRVPWRIIQHRAIHRAHVHDLDFASTSPPAVTMLRNARDKYAATAPPKKQLEKDLFPSSSPRASQNGNIEQIFKQPSRPTSFFGARQPQPQKPSVPLKQSSVNIARGPSAALPSTTVSKSSQAFASICAKEDSFQESPEIIGSRELTSGGGSRYIAGVLINDDDFDDDDDLDIDSAPFHSLPTLPAPPRNTAPVAINKNEPPPLTDTSILSWSQSSDRHFQPSLSRAIQPPAPRHTESNTSVKRDSPDDEMSSPPVAKKRALPSSFQRRQQIPDDDEEDCMIMENNPAVQTPVTKKPNTLWNATASAVQAQKKQLKTQLRKSSDIAQENAVMNPAPRISKPQPKRSAAIALSNEQRHVKQLVVEKGQSVFFTGPAGTGKSVLMRAIIQELRRKYAKDPERVAVTASTGLAACNIGGMTLHSFSGIGLGKEDVGTLVKKIRRNPKAKNRWLRTKVLIMDEVSMVDGELFDKLSQIGRTIRNNGRPWGGIQLVITGDFFQLPPVPDHGAKQRESKFAFEAATWNTSIDHTIGLTEVFRQRDPVFADMLNEMRLGRISDQTVQNFRALSRNLEFTDGLEVTELFPTRNEVESSNERRLRALPGKSYRYESLDTGAPEVRDRLLQNMMAPKALELKKGAQVMLIKNMDDTLVNGSLGTVEDFMSETAFESLPTDDVDAAVKKRISAFTNELETKSTSGDNTKYPLVRFHATDGSSRMLLIVPEDWKVELPTGEIQASRKQIPLILAWALSIHKAQGQTLERVKVDLGRVFEKGQAYVALSRATTQEGLQVLRFDKNRVMAHPRVIGFYNKLYSAETATGTGKKTTASMSNFVYKQGAHGTAKDLREGPDEDEEALVAAYS